MGAGESRIIQVTLKAIADMSDVTSNVKQIQNLLSQLKLSPNLKGDFTKIFGDIEKNVQRASQAMANGFKTKGDVKAYSTAMEAIERALISMQTNMEKIKPGAFSELLKDNQELQVALQASSTQLQTFKQELANKIAGTDTFKELKNDIATFKDEIKSASVDTFFKKLEEGDIPGAEKALKRLDAVVAKQKKDLQAAGETSGWEKSEQLVERLRQGLQAITSDGNVGNIRQQMTELEQSMKNMSAAELDKLKQEFQQLTGVDLTKLIEEFNRLRQEGEKTGQSQQKLNSELDMFKSRVSYFFGMTNAVMLFRRALRSTFETVKDLDKVMTETAVVTEFDVGDMWSQLPEYTERANQLGVSIHDAYEAATLYYQQGLSTNEVMAVSNETLKMARIAGLDAAEATDRMTNALRGFNMEITESNAQNINDVYSNLAAKTASNVDEISTAMTKVASLAHNANMSFENTAAFLSQIIETTRESAETAGTALKTVIARFSEVKKLYSTGDLLGTDEEGEEINVNKVSAALRTAGINLNEYLTGMKGLDDIFMELSEKWDSLDQVQQRYIATMAAGSRQQSRFIALMQDNARMTELVGYANNAAGASEKQFEKTLESLESKLNELKNSWKTFLMGIANSDIIKIVVDALKGFLDAINNLTSSLPGLGKSFANITIAVTLFAAARGLLGKTLGPIATLFRKEGEEATKAAGGLTIYNTTTGEVARNSLVLQNALMGLGSAFLILSSLIDNGTESGRNVAKWIRGIGIAVAGAGAAIKVLGGLLNVTKVQVLGFGFAFKTGANMVGEGIAEAGIKAQIGLGWIGVAITALSGIVIGLIALHKQLTKNSPENKLKQAKKATERASKAAEEAKQSYDNLNNSLESLGEKYQTIQNLTKGTLEWRDSVQDVNSKVLELMNNYKELIPYVKNVDGLLTIDTSDENIQNILDKYSQNAFYTASAQAYSQKQELQLEVEIDYDKVKKIITEGVSLEDSEEELFGNVMSKALSGMKDLRTFPKRELINTISKALAGDEKSQKEIEKSGVERYEGESEASYITRVFGALQEGSYDFLTITESNINQLREYGNTLMETEAQQQAYTDAIAANAIALANIGENTEGGGSYATNYLNPDRMEQLLTETENEVMAEIERGREATKGNPFVENEAWKGILQEFAEIQGKSSYKEAVEDNEGKEFSEKEIIDAVVSKRATERATSAVENFASEFEQLPDLIKRVYEETEGGALTRGDLGKNISDEIYKAYADSIGKEVSDLSALEKILANAAYGKYAFDTEQAQNFGEQRFQQTEDRLNSKNAGLNFNKVEDLTAGNYEKFVDNFLNMLTASGIDSGKNFTKKFNKVTEDMSSDEVNKFVNKLNSIDWKDLDKINNLRADMEAADITIASSDEEWNEFINSIIEGMGAISKLSPEEAIEQIGSKSELARKIRSGDQKEDSFSEEDYALLIDSNAELAKDFIKVGDEYHYIGSDMTTLADALSENTAALLESTSEQLDTKIGVGEMLSEYDNPGLKGEADLKQQQQAIDEIIGMAINRGLDLNKLGIAGLSNNSKGSDFDETQASSTINAILQVLTEYKNGLYGQQKETVNTQGTSNAASGNTIERNARMAGTVGGEEYAKMLIDQAEQAGVAKESIDKYREALQSTDEVERGIAAKQLLNLINLEKEIELYDLDADAVKEFAKQLEKTNDNLDPTEVRKLAVANARFERGLQKLADTYDDWTSILDESGKVGEITGSEQAKTFKELKDTVKDLLSVEEDLPEQFFKSTQNMELLKQAAEGNIEVISQLRAAAAESVVLDITGAANYDELDEVGQEVVDLINSWKIPDMEVGAFLQDRPFIESLNNLMQQMKLSTTQMNKIWSGLGFTAEVIPQEPYTASYTVPVPSGSGPTYAPNIVSGPMALQAAMQNSGVSDQTKKISIPQFRYVFKGNDAPTSYTPASPSKTGSCFVAGTLVTTFSGLKPIESIQMGDIVLSYNEQTHQNEYSAVLQTMIHDVTENIYTLHIENDILEVTGIHRFYITRNNKKSWVSVQDFQENDFVQFADGTLHRIEKIEIKVRTTRVYNFEVSNNHNYYVGENQVLAHNKSGGCFAAGTLVTLQGFYKNIEQVSVGDVVLSYNEEKKRNEYSTVIQTMIHLVKEKIYTLYVGRDKLVVTGIHRFYITREEETSWISAEELCVGDKVRFADGTLHDITKISTEEKSLIVYNFEVSNTHNYYVGRSQILAHNKSNNSGGGKDNKWKNPFDELFNLQEKINASIRERESLERKYQKLIQDAKTTTGDIRKNYTDQIKALRTQISLQKKMKAGRLKQIKDLGNQKFTYENSEGKTVTTTFKKMGVTKYASFDKNTGAITIDWKGLEKLTKKTTDANKGAAAEEYINQLKELADSVNEINSTTEDIEQTIRDQNLEALGLYNDFEERMKDAVVAGREKEIEKLEALSDAINDSSQKVIQGIQDQIAAQRQARENEKTEKDLADKEARLAYLQRDTSGANQAEIMALQKEIDEARQNYEDTLIDQTIDQMSKDADLAAEQRASQIQLMQDQLAVYQETGAIWKDVYSLINGMFTTDGKINWDSKGANILKNAEGYSALSNAGKYLWQQETQEGVFGAVQGMEAGNMNKAGDSVVLDKTITEGLKKHIAAMFVVRKDHGGWSEKRMKEVFGSGAKKEIWDLVNTYKKKPPKNMKNWATDKYTFDKQKNIKYSKYATGGLVDFTGPAWLDGTKSKPEIVLNAADSKNLVILKDVLASLLSGKNSSNSKNGGGDNYFDIDITAELKNDYDVDQLAARIKKQIQQDGQYRNVNAISFLR